MKKKFVFMRDSNGRLVSIAESCIVKFPDEPTQSFTESVEEMVERLKDHRYIEIPEQVSEAI